MHILIIEPGKHPCEADVPNDLKALQQIVGGYLEAIYPFEDRVALVCDEEAKLKANSRWNRVVQERGDVIKGSVIQQATSSRTRKNLPKKSTVQSPRLWLWIEPFAAVLHRQKAFMIQGICLYFRSSK